MKCKWYANFEGVCTNGECPYRGDTCPTCEHPEVCKYSENKYEVSELVNILRCCSNIGYICEECPANLDGEDCDGRLAKLQAADMIEKLAAEKDAKKLVPKNRVLMLEEVVRGDAMWYEDRTMQGTRVVILGYGQNEPGFTKLIDYLGDKFYRRDDAYNDFWRCWLRKPTEAERRETPWEGDSRE